MFLLGDDILAAPVVVPGATTRTAVLPPGRWVDRATGAYVESDGTTSITVPAPLDTLPMWHREASIVPMYARIADTLLPATAAGVTSYTDRAYGRELRLVYTPLLVAPLEAPTAATRLHDGSSASAYDNFITLEAGSEYDVFTVDVDARGLTGRVFAAPTAVLRDGTSLPMVSDVTTCAAPGCWSFDAATKRLQARVFGSAMLDVR